MHLTSWFLLLQSPFISFFSSQAVSQKLLSLFLALFTPYVLLSNSYEALFVVGLASLLYQWVVVEHHLDSHYRHQPVSSSLKEVVLATHNETVASYSLRRGDIRRVIFALLFGMLSFFGTGNIASINTFDPSYVYCFKTVFSPFHHGRTPHTLDCHPFPLGSLCVQHCSFACAPASKARGIADTGYV